MTTVLLQRSTPPCACGSTKCCSTWIGIGGTCSWDLPRSTPSSISLLQLQPPTTQRKRDGDAAGADCVDLAFLVRRKEPGPLLLLFADENGWDAADS